MRFHRTMTIDRLSELYEKGYSSKANFYLGLIEILAETDDANPILENVPAEVVDEVIDMAARHVQSARDHASFDEAKNPEKILLWRSRLSTLGPRSNGTTPEKEKEQDGESRVVGHLD
jgi:hypothetical protein